MPEAESLECFLKFLNSDKSNPRRSFFHVFIMHKIEWCVADFWIVALSKDKKHLSISYIIQLSWKDLIKEFVDIMFQEPYEDTNEHFLQQLGKTKNLLLAHEQVRYEKAIDILRSLLEESTVLSLQSLSLLSMDFKMLQNLL